MQLLLHILLLLNDTYENIFFGLKLNCLHNILYTRFSTLTEELRDSENVIIETLNTSLIRSEMDFKQNLHAAYLSCLEMHVTVSCLI